MEEINLFPSDYSSEIIGYVEPWIASPGDRVDVKVGSTTAAACIFTFRLYYAQSQISDQLIYGKSK